jgi:uncharacterized protein YegP (UPF0339 family)
VPLARFATYVARGHSSGASKYGWRLLAANNRDGARSASLFEELDLCHAAIRRLRADFDRGEPVVARMGRSEWSWRLVLDDIDIAISSRTYKRRLQCAAACDLFVELAPAAELAVPAQLAQSAVSLLCAKRIDSA